MTHDKSEMVRCTQREGERPSRDWYEGNDDPFASLRDDLRERGFKIHETPTSLKGRIAQTIDAMMLDDRNNRPQWEAQLADLQSQLANWHAGHQ